MKTKTCFRPLCVLVWFHVALAALAQNATLLTAITNPTPATSDHFGYSVAGVGNDRVLIGTPQDYNATGLSQAGAAYLFNANGTLLTTFTDPVPEVQEVFGWCVAAVGNDRVLIGAPRHGNTVEDSDAGTAYLFNTNGAWLNTFTNPIPVGAGYLGWSVAGAGSDRVLIGAPYQDNPDVWDAGAAYLFSTDGTLLTTFTNQNPAYYENLGWSVAAVGTDRVIIGAPGVSIGAVSAGAAYLFSTDGTLLTTILNPTPAANDNFGFSVAALGSDRVLIGAPYDGTVASDAGAAYLFSTSGTLLRTFTTPTPVEQAHFGIAVAAVGSDRVLIGAYSDSSFAPGAGTAYLFNTNGTLLTTVTNPTAIFEYFGWSLAAVGSDRVVIGAYQDNTGAANAGAAYLFNVAPAVVPSLSIALTSTNTALVSWPSPSNGWTLQENTNSVSSTNWVDHPFPQDNGTIKFILANPPTGNRFYRLFKP